MLQFGYLRSILNFKKNANTKFYKTNFKIKLISYNFFILKNINNLINNNINFFNKKICFYINNQVFFSFLVIKFNKLKKICKKLLLTNKFFSVFRIKKIINKKIINSFIKKITK